MTDQQAIPRADLIRFAHGLPPNATAEDRNSYAQFCLAIYREKKWDPESLAEYFSDDFETFTVDHFKEIDKLTRRDIRDFLRANGVFCPKGTGIAIPSALYLTCHEHPPWPADERSNMPLTSEGPALSNVREVHPHEREPQEPAIFERDQAEPFDSYDRNNIPSLLKAYSFNDDKYSGDVTENFEKKLQLFYERCEQTGVQQKDYAKAFSAMLRGTALQYYLDAIRGQKMSMDDIISRIRKRFITAEGIRSLIQEFETTSLTATMRSNPGKTPKECLHMMIARLQELQACLPAAFRSDVILSNRLLNAVRDVEACRLAIHKPAESVEGIIADLTSSISSYPGAPSASVNFVDRKYRQSRRSTKKCFVCNKIGCWSSNHPASERMSALKKKKPQIRALLSQIDESDSSKGGSDSEPLEDVVVNLLDLRSATAECPDDTTVDANWTSMLPPGVVDELSDFATCHALTGSVSVSRRYDQDTFFGILIDTGCSHASTSSETQYLAYCRFVGQQPRINTERSARCRFGIGQAMSKGTAEIAFPLSGMKMKFLAHIVDADMPMLLSLADMDRLKLTYDNLGDLLHHHPSGARAKITRVYGHPFLTWHPMLETLFTEQELRQLHRRFGHPETDRLLSLLRRAAYGRVDDSTRRALRRIVRHCHPCQVYASKPNRFKFTLHTDPQFNHSVFVDVLYLDKQPILHVVDQATRYQAARWLPAVSSAALWRALRLCWIDVYLGPPDIIVHDAAKSFLAAEFKSSSGLLHVETKQVPVEAPQSMTYVERYHTPLRKAFRKITQDAPDLDRDAALQMAVKAVNDSVGPDGLVPTLLVYGALPRLGLPSDAPSPSMQARAAALRDATEELSRYFARRQVRDALRTRNGPNVTDIHATPLGSHVLVYRPHLDRWDGPFTLINLEGETCTVLTPAGPTLFRTTVVKPYLSSASTEAVAASEDVQSSEQRTPVTNTHPVTATPSAHDINIAAFHAIVHRVSNRSPAAVPTQFAESRKHEIDGLIARGVFAAVPRQDAIEHRIYGGRFVDTLKNAGTDQALAKSRFVVQAFNDKNHGLLTFSPTVQRSSQRLLLALAAIFPEFSLFTRDVSQAYTQSATPVRRPVYVEPPPELNLSPDVVLRVQTPLYGLPEAGVHWFNTYHNHHVANLGMRAAPHDMCLLFTAGATSASPAGKTVPRGVVCLQTDDTLVVGNDAFKALEAQQARRFRVKPTCQLSPTSPVTFNGALLSMEKGAITISQACQIDKLQLLETAQVSPADYVSQRARGGYIASVCRPDLSFGFSYAAQTSAYSEQDVTFLNTFLSRALATPTTGLRYVPLDTSSLSLAVFVDASFATNADLSSQLGYVITLLDSNHRANIVHYASCKCKRVTRSVLAAELYAMVLGFDVGFAITTSLRDIFGRPVPLQLYTDSKCLYDCMTTLKSTTEKRLLIDLSCLREGYERREISDIFWIPGSQNPADALTKASPCSALANLMSSNHIMLTPNAWVERASPSWTRAAKPTQNVSGSATTSTNATPKPNGSSLLRSGLN